MAVIVNQNTRQNPMAAAGQTGVQVVKFIDAPRIYIKATDANATPVTTKSNGTTPGGWTDLGIVDGKVKVTYTKQSKDVRTGIDQVLRAVYVDKKAIDLEFHLSQFDDVVMTQLTGITASVITSGSIVQFSTGSEDVVQKALLLVFDNKLDGKEWQFYSPNAYITLSFGDNGDETFVMGKAELPSFAWAGAEALCIQTMFA